MQPVSLTAQWTAAIRALESERVQGALFHDDLARYLALPDGFELLKRYRGAGVREFVVIRTRYFDDAISEILSKYNEIRQVVIVAAGMDTRAYRLTWPQSVQVYELDHAALLQEKASRLAKLQVQSKANRIEVPVDLAQDWVPALIDAGFKAQAPTLWLVEGLLFFLTESQVSILLSACRALSASGSQVVVDMTSNALLRSPFSQLFLATLRKEGVPWQFGTDEPEEFLSCLGWNVWSLKEPGSTEAGAERWPYKSQSRAIPGVARSWLISAAAI